MNKIAILSPSVRRGRNSHRVALFFRNYIEENRLAEADIIDLAEYNFPLFDERLRMMKEPSTAILSFADRIPERRRHYHPRSRIQRRLSCQSQECDRPAVR
ncbi:MAG: NAD(P)H-dependent oxidoreductase [Marinilabiliales bacterium]|nr:NAD(P)H-dependent oxidoreductase [Marinilabiliales bacterium]